MTRSVVVAAALGALAAGALAWQGPTRSDTPPPVAPRVQPRTVATAASTKPRRAAPGLMVKISPERPAESLGVSQAHVDVVIAGYVAQTTTTLTFRNTHGRILEGELVFPLPEGAVVSGYGLDVGGEIVDGVVVEKQAARVAFESEVRRGVDPGLVEWVQGNTFRTRVWPIPAGGARTVKLQYVSDVVTQGAGPVTGTYVVPLDFGRPLEDLDVKVRVSGGAGAPEARGLDGLRFGRWGDGYVADAALHDVPPTELTVVLPQMGGRAIAVEETEDGEAYFVIDDFPAAGAGASRKARRIGLAWDKSLSAARGHTTRERALLERWVHGLGEVEVVVTVFRDRPESPRTFQLPGGALEMLRFLDASPDDGGTALDALRFGSDCAYHVLVSDGLATLGDALPAVLQAPVYTVSGAAEANHPLLREIAERSGGAHFNLARVDDAAVLGGIGADAFSFLGADPGQVADVFPAGRRAVQGRFTLTGRLLGPEARLTARFGREGEAPVTRTYTLRRSDASDTGGLVPRRWAQQKVAALSVFPERHHDELLATGRRFGLVTPGTSLLVLETVEQHLEHRVEPPRSRKVLYAEYQRRTDAAARRSKQAGRDKLDRVAAMWQEQVRWWETQFPRQGMKIQRRDDADLGVPFDLEEGVEGGVAGGVAGGVVGGVVGGLPEAVPMEAPRSAPPATPQPAPAFDGLARRRPGAAAFALKAEAEPHAGGGEGATITIRAWDPRTPYLASLRRAGPAGAYAAYLAERDRFGTSPAFFLDCADHLFRAEQRELAVRVLTSVAELQLEEPRLLRVAAHRLQQAGALDLAIGLFEKVRRLRPEEPQSLRDLALALAARADTRREEARGLDESATGDYRRAIDLLNRVVLGEWDGRFPGVEVLALLEANRIVAVLERGGARPDDLPLDPRLVRLLEADVRIVLTWDTDQTDMDLWVVEPTGEKCFYSHPLTTLGGRISKDFTGGYGPEEYMVRRARPGLYRVKANYYGSRAQGLAGPTTVQATVITDFGRPEEKRRSVTLRLTEARDVVDVGEVRFDPSR